MSENAWIEWSGADQPVADDVMVDVEFGDGEIVEGSIAGEWAWTHDASYIAFGSQIVRYRLSGPLA